MAEIGTSNVVLCILHEIDLWALRCRTINDKTLGTGVTVRGVWLHRRLVEEGICCGVYKHARERVSVLVL